MGKWLCFKHLCNATNMSSILYIMHPKGCLYLMQNRECEEQFERMQQAGGMGSAAELASAFVTAEAANFELFNQVAGINVQAAQLQELIVQQQASYTATSKSGCR